MVDWTQVIISGIVTTPATLAALATYRELVRAKAEIVLLKAEIVELKKRLGI